MIEPPSARPFGGEDLMIALNIKDPKNQYDSEVLTRSFSTLGISPRLEMNTGQEVILLKYLSFNGSHWNFKIGYDELDSSWPIFTRIYAEDKSILGCSVRNLTVDLSIPWLQSYHFGYNMNSTTACFFTLILDG
jgi:hypothetical protein